MEVRRWCGLSANMTYATKLTRTMATAMDRHSGQGANAHTELKRRSVPRSVLRFPNRRSRLLTKTSNSHSNALIQAGDLLPPRSVRITSSRRDPRDLSLAPWALDLRDRGSSRFSRTQNHSAWTHTGFPSSLEDTPVAIRESYKLGANSYVQKPVDFGLFCKVLLNIEAYWLHLNLAPPPSGQNVTEEKKTSGK